MSIIYYQKFSENEVFNDALLNTSLNQIFTFLSNTLSEQIVTQELLLDGDVAKLLQGYTVSNAVTKVELITANKSIFNTLKSSYSAFKITQIIIEESQITLLINSKLIKVSYSSSLLQSTNIDGIFVKLINPKNAD